MKYVLLAYSTVDGHTLHICERMQQVVQHQGHRVELLTLEQADAADLAEFDAIVIGASVRYGHHRPLVAQFINRHQAMLESRISAFFSVNIVARKPEKSHPKTNPYLRKFLRKISWRPALLEVFAGKLDYPHYRLLDRLMIQLIMHLTHGPTDPGTVIEFTDWDRVDDFALRVCQAL